MPRKQDETQENLRKAAIHMVDSLNEWDKTRLANITKLLISGASNAMLAKLLASAGEG